MKDPQFRLLRIIRQILLKVIGVGALRSNIFFGSISFKANLLIRLINVLLKFDLVKEYTH